MIIVMIVSSRLWPILLGLILLLSALFGSQLAPLPALSAKLFPQNPEAIVSPANEGRGEAAPELGQNTIPAAVQAVRQLPANAARQPVVRCRQGLCAARQGTLIAVAPSRAAAREQLSRGRQQLDAGKDLPQSERLP